MGPLARRQYPRGEGRKEGSNYLFRIEERDHARCVEVILIVAVMMFF
jgi:hypothetical protein